MMSRVIRQAGGLLAWVEDNGYLVTFLLTQGLTAFWWASHADSRLAEIEKRGSPEVAALVLRVAALELGDKAQNNQLTNIENIRNRMGTIETRLITVETIQNTVLDSLKTNSSKLDHAIDILNAHMAGENNKTRTIK